MRRVLAAVAIAAAVATLTLSSCERSPSNAAHVVRSGFSVRGPLLGVAAVVRTGDEGWRKIALRITYRTHGEILRVDRAEVPFCGAKTDCPWGQSVFGERIGPKWRDIDSVDVAVTGTGNRSELSPVILRTEVVRGEVAVTTTGREGTAFVLAYDKSVPRFAINLFVRRGERKTFRYGPHLLPLANGETVKAVLYPGRVPGTAGD